MMMGRACTGQAVCAERRTPNAIEELRRFRDEKEAEGNLAAWRRAHATLRYIDGEAASSLATQLGVDRSSVNRWLIWYDESGIKGLETQRQPGAPPRLTDEQRDELFEIVRAGPQAAGFTTGVWTGPMIGTVIQQKFKVTYHHKSIPRLLRDIGLSVQRPRKRLAKADAEAQKVWIEERLPAIKKKQKKKMV